LGVASVSSWKLRLRFVRENAEWLPRTVDAIVPGGERVEDELDFEFGQGLLLHAPAENEGVERGQGRGVIL